MSAGLNRRDFETWPGFEEGVTELLEHALLPDICDAFGMPDLTAGTAYRRYDDALRALCGLADTPVRDACLELIQTVLTQREWRVVEMIARASPERGAAWAYRQAEPHFAALKPRRQ